MHRGMRKQVDGDLRLFMLHSGAAVRSAAAAAAMLPIPVAVKFVSDTM